MRSIGEAMMMSNLDSIEAGVTWLHENPDANSGAAVQPDKWRTYYHVDHVATTDDNSRFTPQGIYFGHRESYSEEGSRTGGSELTVTNHNNDEKSHGCVPLTYKHEPQTGRYIELVDRAAMERSSDPKQIGRMARNIREVRKHYGEPENRLGRLLRMGGYVLGLPAKDTAHNTPFGRRRP